MSVKYTDSSQDTVMTNQDIARMNTPPPSSGDGLKKSKRRWSTRLKEKK